MKREKYRKKQEKLFTRQEERNWREDKGITGSIEKKEVKGREIVKERKERKGRGENKKIEEIEIKKGGGEWK